MGGGLGGVLKGCVWFGVWCGDTSVRKKGCEISREGLQWEAGPFGLAILRRAFQCRKPRVSSTQLLADTKED